MKKYELEIKKHVTNPEGQVQYYVARKGKSNPLFTQNEKTTRLSLEEANRLLRQLTNQMEASDGTIQKAPAKTSQASHRPTKRR